MNPANGDRSIPIPAEVVEELAASGALCPECGGLCVPNIDAAIMAAYTMRNAGIEVPWCRCAECQVCKPLRDAIHRLMRERTYHEFLRGRL